MVGIPMIGNTGFKKMRNVKTVLGLASLLAAGTITSAIAQTVESIPFRVNMSPRNEVPAVDNPAVSGFATIWVHVVRDATGKITSGTVDFGVRYQFPDAITITGLHIHKGDAGTNGPVLIDTRFSADADALFEMLPDDSLIQIGGKASIGRGLCRVVVK